MGCLHEAQIFLSSDMNLVVQHRFLSGNTNLVGRHTIEVFQFLSDNTKFSRTTQNSVGQHKIQSDNTKFSRTTQN
jgi:hypothetical protein